MSNPNLSSTQFADAPKAQQPQQMDWSTFWPEPLIKHFKPQVPDQDQKWKWKWKR